MSVFNPFLNSLVSSDLKIISHYDDRETAAIVAFNGHMHTSLFHVVGYPSLDFTSSSSIMVWRMVLVVRYVASVVGSLAYNDLAPGNSDCL